MPSNHLLLCCPLLLPPSIFPRIRILSSESVLCIRWPKYRSFSFSISPSNGYSGLISLGLTSWISLQSKGLSKVFSNTTVQKHNFFHIQLSLESNSYIHGRRQWQPTLLLLPGKSHVQRSLVGCSPWGHEELDMTEQLHFHFSLSCIGEGNGNPLQCSCLENPRDAEAWWAAIYGFARSQTWLKWLSSSSSSHPYMTTGKTMSLIRWTFVVKVISLLFNVLSRLVVDFSPRSKCLLISWLKSPFAMILEPPPKYSLSLFPHLFAMKWWDQMPWS